MKKFTTKSDLKKWLSDQFEYWEENRYTVKFEVFIEKLSDKFIDLVGKDSSHIYMNDVEIYSWEFEKKYY